MILAVVVHPADVQDRDGAKLVLAKLKGQFERLQLIWADGGYSGVLIDWVYKFGGWDVAEFDFRRRPCEHRPAQRHAR